MQTEILSQRAVKTKPPPPHTHTQKTLLQNTCIFVKVTDPGLIKFDSSILRTCQISGRSNQPFIAKLAQGKWIFEGNYR